MSANSLVEVPQNPALLDAAPIPFEAKIESLINAERDEEVIDLWLSLVGRGSANTYAAYRCETQRFLAWMQFRGVVLRGVKLEDVAAFEGFLRDPPEALIGPRKPASSAEWRPFASKLSSRSVVRSLSVISSLFSFLQEGRWITGNPVRFFLEATKSQRKGDQPLRRKPLPEDVELSVTTWVTGQGEGHPTDRWTIGALLFLGLRVSELCQAKMSDLRKVDGRWYLRVFGKGSKVRDVAVSEVAMRLLRDYRETVGLPVDPSGEVIPLVGSKLDPRRFISRRAMYKRVVALGFRVSGDAVSEGPVHPHLYRHTAASRWLRSGAHLLSVRDQLGHSSVTTTEIYLDRPDALRHDDTAGLDDKSFGG